MKEDIHIRIDKDVMRAVRAFATYRGISLAAAVSICLREKFGLPEPEKS